VNFTVKAPISGTIINKPPEPGESSRRSLRGGGRHGRRANRRFFDVMVETDVPSSVASDQTRGPGEITLDAFPDIATVPGPSRSHRRSIAPRPRSSSSRVRDEKRRRFAGMSARVSFLSGELDKDAVKAPAKTIVPSEALADRNGAKVVS